MSLGEFSYSVYSSTQTVNTGDVLSLGSTGWRKLISAGVWGAVGGHAGDQVWDLVITNASSAPIYRNEIVRIHTPNDQFYPIDANGQFITAEHRLKATAVGTRLLSTGGNSSAVCTSQIPDNVFIPPGSFVSVFSVPQGGAQIYYISVITDSA